MGINAIEGHKEPWNFERVLSILLYPIKLIDDSIKRVVPEEELPEGMETWDDILNTNSNILLQLLFATSLSIASITVAIYKNWDLTREIDKLIWINSFHVSKTLKSKRLYEIQEPNFTSITRKDLPINSWNLINREPMPYTAEEEKNEPRSFDVNQ